MDTQLLMKTAMLAGELMIRSGAETYRVEDTMHHILKTAEEVESAEIVVMMTGICATLKRKEEAAVTMVKRVDQRDTNMNRVVCVNDISRRYCGQYLSLHQAYQELKELKSSQYSTLTYHIATIGACAGFALMFSGKFLEALSSAIVGIALTACISMGKKLRLHAFICDVIASIAVAFVSIVLEVFLQDHINMDIVMISAIMPLVPGMAITNAVRDTLKGDYISGAARTLEAFLKASGIALGVGIGISLFGSILLKGGI